MPSVEQPESPVDSGHRSSASLCRATLYGLFVGDALAMPVHWYYDRHALLRDYGLVTEYVAPRNPHPESILWRSSYQSPNSLGDILHDQAPYWGHPFRSWLSEPDDMVVGRRLSTACYVDDSVPAVLYLALKYHNDLQRGLIANTSLGGDNAYRGAVLGALLGAGNGMEAFPERWISGLFSPPPELEDCTS